MTYIIKYKETNGKGDCYFKDMLHEKYNYIEYYSMAGTRLKSMAKVYKRKGYADKIAQKLAEEYNCKDIEVVEFKEALPKFKIGDKVKVVELLGDTDFKLGQVMTINDIYIDTVLEAGEVGKVIYYFEETFDGCYEEELCQL